MDYWIDVTMNVIYVLRLLLFLVESGFVIV